MQVQQQTFECRLIKIMFRFLTTEQRKNGNILSSNDKCMGNRDK